MCDGGGGGEEEEEAARGRGGRVLVQSLEKASL